MDYTLKNLKNPRNRKAGVAEYALLAAFADFATGGVKSPVAPFTVPGDSLTIKDAHEFLPGKAFAQYSLAPGKNEYGYKSVGDRGFQSLNSELKIFIPGSYEEAHEAVRNLMNVPLIVLIKDSECSADLFYQLGCDCQFAYLGVDFTTATTSGGNKGFTGTITYDDGPQFYRVAGGPEVLSANAPACPLISVAAATANSLTFDFNEASYSNGHQAKLFIGQTNTTTQSGATQNLPQGTSTVTFTALNANQVYYVEILPKDQSGTLIHGCAMVGAKTEAS